MALQQRTRQIIETSVDRKEKFDRGNVSGKWVDKDWYRSGSVGSLPSEFTKVLNEHSKLGDLFVIYSYLTPIAWYSLNDSYSQGTNKWYYPNTRYSVSTSSHQSAVRYALRGQDVEILESK